MCSVMKKMILTVCIHQGIALLYYHCHKDKQRDDWSDKIDNLMSTSQVTFNQSWLVMEEFMIALAMGSMWQNWQCQER